MPSFNTSNGNLGMLWGNVRQHLWVPFRVRFPLKEVFPFKVKKIIDFISILTQLSVEAPTANNRAIFHLTTVRFPSFSICEELGPLNATLGTWDMCGDRRKSLNSQGSRYHWGKNILGTNGWIDIERTYDMTRSIGKSGSTGKLTTHMEVDKIEVDFGFITNAGKNKSSTEQGLRNILLRV